MPVTAAIQTRIAEDIALLHSFGENPNVSVRPLPCKRNVIDGYSISLDIEKEFASDMAFLSSIRDDPTKITAVAVHETGDGSLRVVVAVNASQKSSNKAYLEEVKRAFDSITRAMSLAGTTPEVQLETSLLDLIVHRCKLRILQRIWRHDPTLLPSHLDEAVKILEAKKQDKEQIRFITNARILLDKLQSIGISSEKGTKSIKVSDLDMKALVRCCCEWEREQDLENFLKRNLRPNLFDFNPSKAWSIRNVVRKIGRYHTCATRLTQLAVNHVIFRRIQTACVSLDQKALHHHAQPNRAPVDEVMMRVSAGQFTETQLSNLLQHAAPRVAMSRRKFRASLKIAQGEDAKVHAEVQLVWYLKSLSWKKPPRVIQSNKLACYLCSALIACTGEYEPARSHGRLYPGWRLPSAACNGVHKTFAICLEGYIVDSLKELVESGVMRKGSIADCESSVTVHRVPVGTPLSPLLEIDEKQQRKEVEIKILETEETTETPCEYPHGSNPQGTIRSSVQDVLELRAAKGDEGVPKKGNEESIEDDVEQAKAALVNGDTDGRSQGGQGPVNSMDWIRLPRGQIVHTRPCETLQVLIEHDNQKMAGENELRVRIRQLFSKEGMESFSRQDVCNIDELTEKEVTCGKGGDPVFMRLGSQVFVVEIDGTRH